MNHVHTPHRPTRAAMNSLSLLSAAALATAAANPRSCHAKFSDGNYTGTTIESDLGGSGTISDGVTGDGNGGVLKDKDGNDDAGTGTINAAGTLDAKVAADGEVDSR